jgi:predicted O-linked N-acetylglucosamine transferase (SPINDLY family)
MLEALELPQLIARDRADYVRIAAELAAHRSLRDDLGTTITTRAARLFDDEAPLRALANFLVAAAHGDDLGPFLLARTT